MKTVFLISLIAFAIGIFAGSSSAQTRINFARGATSAVVSGTLKGYKDHKTYVIRVRKGQSLSTESIGKNHITIIVKAPPGSHFEQDMAADCHDQNDVSPTVSGEYRLTVTECLKADAYRGRFSFRVHVR